MNPGMHLCVCRQHSQFWPILKCFVDYYSRFWGPEVISIVVELQAVLTCWSSTLAVLADSGPFHGLEDLHNSHLTFQDLAFSEEIHKKASHDQIREC